MIEDNYTSPELSKKLKKNGCKLESECGWVERGGKWLFTDEFKYLSVDGGVPAYDILNDICVKYAKEFFGEEKTNCTFENSISREELLSYEVKSVIILSLFQRGKKKEAEDYIWEHCLFNPKNR